MTTSNRNDFPQLLTERYEIQELLGKKAGRKTFLARDLNTEQPVIIKLLTFGKDFVWEDLKLFEREAETLKALEHPSIPRYIDYFEVDSKSGKSYALVQSYVAGKSLEELLQEQGKLNEKTIKNIAKQLLKILDYLHARQPPVIHRDIKPSNIIFSGKNVYLVDFGSVQTLFGKAGKTITVVGTYGYMPPEQFGGYATPASDLYSLGATLIALATGIPPADLPQKDMRIYFAQHSQLSPEFSEWLEWLVEPNVEKRAKNVTEASVALETGQLTIAEDSSILVKYKPVGTFRLLWIALWRSTFIGGTIVAICASLYCTALYPGLATIAGGTVGAMIGYPIGIINGILLWIITRLFFFPLKNPKLHQRTVTLISIIFSTAIALIGFHSLNMHGGTQELVNIIFFGTAPSIITGLSMGTLSKSFSEWYLEQYRKKRF
ncbi:MAG: serine/threonine protein kinase [Calothrix sp. SM1_7_51]|nr:serine/threonine protein kinase [Calothrix sp. SM1_7_51]